MQKLRLLSLCFPQTGKAGEQAELLLMQYFCYDTQNKPPVLFEQHRQQQFSDITRLPEKRNVSSAFMISFFILLDI